MSAFLGSATISKVLPFKVKTHMLGLSGFHIKIVTGTYMQRVSFQVHVLALLKSPPKSHRQPQSSFRNECRQEAHGQTQPAIYLPQLHFLFRHAVGGAAGTGMSTRTNVQTIDTIRVTILFYKSPTRGIMRLAFRFQVPLNCAYVVNMHLLLRVYS